MLFILLVICASVCSAIAGLVGGVVAAFGVAAMVIGTSVWFFAAFGVSLIGHF